MEIMCGGTYKENVALNLVLAFFCEFLGFDGIGRLL